jgi:Eukaryotic-type carbonic anhydrase
LEVCLLCSVDEQLWKLRTLNHNNVHLNETDEPLVDNFRPVQPLNGRTVLRTFHLQSELVVHDSSGLLTTARPVAVAMAAVIGYLAAIGHSSR